MSTDSPEPDPTAPGLRPSRAVSAQYDRTCPVCGAEPLAPCRSRSGRVTDAHHARLSRPTTATGRSLTENQAKVLAAVVEAEVPHTVFEIAGQLGMLQTSVRTAVMGLQQRGLLTVVGSAASGGQTYGPTQAGRAR